MVLSNPIRFKQRKRVVLNLTQKSKWVNYSIYSIYDGI